MGATDQRQVFRPLPAVAEEIFQQATPRGERRDAVLARAPGLLRQRQEYRLRQAPVAVGKALQQLDVGLEHRLEHAVGEQFTDAVPGQQQAVFDPVKLVVEPHLRGLREHIVQVAKHFAKARRDKPRLAQVAGKHHRRRTRMALAPAFAQHFQCGKRRAVDGAMEAALELPHRFGEGQLRCVLTLHQQQSGEVGYYLIDAGLIIVTVEQRHVEQEVRLPAPARQHRIEGGGEHAGQGQAVAGSLALQALGFRAAEDKRLAAETRFADRLGRAGQRQRRAIGQLRQALAPVLAVTGISFGAA
ncbi:hypothetical protein D3C79_638280 [compost metagenome]